MERKRDGFVPVGDLTIDLSGGLVPARRQARHFTMLDQVTQLVAARDADPDRALIMGEQDRAWRGLLQRDHPLPDHLLDVGAYKSFLWERRRLVAERLNEFFAVSQEPRMAP